MYGVSKELSLASLDGFLDILVGMAPACGHWLSLLRSPAHHPFYTHAATNLTADEASNMNGTPSTSCTKKDAKYLRNMVFRHGNLWDLYRKIVVCTCEEFAYYGPYSDCNQCAECNRPKCDGLVAHYLNLSEWIRMWKGSPGIANALRWHSWRDRIDPDIMLDVVDGSLYSEWVDDGHDPCKDVAIGILPDGVRVRSKRKGNKNVWLVVMTVANLPPWLRTKSEYILPLIVVPVDRPKGSEPPLRTYYAPMTQMLHDLSSMGTLVYDAHVKTSYIARVDVLWQVADSPGLAAVINHSVGGYYGCHQHCQHRAQRLVVSDHATNQRHDGMTYCYLQNDAYLSDACMPRCWSHDAVCAHVRHIATIPDAPKLGPHGTSAHMLLPKHKLGEFANARYDLSMHGLKNIMQRLYQLMFNDPKMGRKQAMRVELSIGVVKAGRWVSPRVLPSDDVQGAMSILCANRPPWEVSDSPEFNRRFAALYLPHGSKSKVNPATNMSRLKCAHWCDLCGDMSKYLLHGLLGSEQQKSLFQFIDACVELIKNRRIRKTALPQAHCNMLEALVELETHWPAIAFTRIMHSLVHANVSVRLLGYPHPNPIPNLNPHPISPRSHHFHWYVACRECIWPGGEKGEV